MIPKSYSQNYQSILDAAKQDRLCLMECQDKETGQPIYALCLVNFVDKEYEFLPVAAMFDSNPYTKLNPPDPDNKDGFIGENE